MSQPAEFNTTTLIVDDTSDLITYSAGWTQGFSGAGIPDEAEEYNKTKHGASSAGTTVKFSFTGTSVAVYGSLGSFDVYGVPVSSYTVDGGNSATYTAPIVEPPSFQVHVLFYQSPPLSAGTHELVITNLNGTSPSVLWIDYILYDPSATTGETGGGGGSVSGSSSSTTPSSSTAPPDSSSTSVSSASTVSPTSAESASASTNASGQSASSTTSPVPSVTGIIGSSSSSASITGIPAADTAVASPGSSKHTSTGAIVGGVIGGLAALALLSTLLFLCFRKRRRERLNLLEPNTTTTPFRYKVPDHNLVISPFADPEERSRLNVLPIKQIASVSAASSAPPASGSSSSSTPRASTASPNVDPPRVSSPLSSPPIIRHTDSGIRIPEPVEIPPEYTQD